MNIMQTLSRMKKTAGIFGLMVAVFIATWIMEPNFITPYNLQNVLRLSSMYAIISIGVAFVIMTGGIDLSIGSVVGLTGCMLPWLIVRQEWPIAASLAAVIGVSAAIGLIHGLLITKVKLQPFIVTLCGLLIYRGLAQWMTGNEGQGFGTAHDDGLRQLSLGKVDIPGTDYKIPYPFIFMALIAVIMAIFLNRTIWGRYLLAMGRNEQAARFSGINTDRMLLVAYVACSLLAGIGSIFFVLDDNSVLPSSHGNGYELYAIAAAVLGGCSLRGGEGSILGVVFGAIVMRLLYNSINILGIPTYHQPTITGAVILVGVLADEALRRMAGRRKSVASIAPQPQAQTPAA